MSGLVAYLHGGPADGTTLRLPSLVTDLNILIEPRLVTFPSSEEDLENTRITTTVAMYRIINPPIREYRVMGELDSGEYRFNFTGTRTL